MGHLGIQMKIEQTHDISTSSRQEVNVWPLSSGPCRGDLVGGFIAVSVELCTASTFVG